MFRTAVRQRRRSSCTDSDDGDADRGHDRGDHLHHRPTVDREKPISKTTTTTVKSTRDYTDDDDHRDGSKKKKPKTNTGRAKRKLKKIRTVFLQKTNVAHTTHNTAAACTTDPQRVRARVHVCVGCVYYRLRCARARHYVCVVCTRGCVGA